MYLAARKIQDDKYVTVVYNYREVDKEDDFVITASVSSKIKQIEKGTLVWQRQM